MYIQGFPGDSDDEESASSERDLGLIPGSRRYHGEGRGYPLHYSCLENFMDREACGLQSMGSQRVGYDWQTNTQQWQHTHTHTHTHTHIFPSGSAVKNPAAVQEMQVQPLSQEEPLEEGMATHSSMLARKIPWAEEPDGLQSIGSQGVRHDWSNWARARCTCNKILLGHKKRKSSHMWWYGWTLRVLC